MFIAALFTISKTWKPPKCPSTDEWIKKMWYIYTVEYYSAIKKNEIVPFATTRMDLEIIIPSEVKQKERQIPYDITYMWNLRYDRRSYLQNRNRLTDIENRLVVAKGGGGMEWEFGISRCKLVYIEWINNNKRSYCVAQGTIFNIL